MESKPSEDRLLVSIAGRVALVRVQGRGSIGVSTSLKEFIQTAMERGANAAVVDLSDCVSMDSTFMGVLAGAAGRLKKLMQGRLSLINLTPKTRDLISTLGLDHTVAAYDAGAMPAEFEIFFASATLARLEKRTDSQLKTAETVLEAHEVLSGLTPENQPRFKDVLEFLRRDVQKAQAPNAGRAP